jgi:hypothetical protein
VASRRTRTRTLVTVAATGALLLVFYSPLLGDILSASNQNFGRQLSWHGPVTTAALDLLAPNVRFAFTSALPPDLPNSAVTADGVIAGVFAAAGALILWRSHERMLTALLVVPVLFTYLMLTIGRFYVEPRFGSFLVFHMFVLAAAAVVGLIQWIPNRRGRTLVAASAGAGVGVVVAHGVVAANRLHELPRENFKEAAAVVHRHGAVRVLTDSTRPTGLTYYLGDRNVIVLPPAQLEQAFCTSHPPLTYIEHPFRGTLDPKPPRLDCLRRRGATRVRVPQRDRGGHLDVWVLTDGR